MKVPVFGLGNWAPPQRKLVMFTMLSFFCLGLPRVVTNATAFALFLETFDASLLPWTYLGAAVAAPAVGAAYLWLQRRVSFWSLILTALLFDIAALAIIRAGLSLDAARPLVMALTIWVEVEWLIAGLVFWGLAERMFDIRETKRLFGVIGAGEPAAVIVGGLLVSLLLTVMPTRDLILVSMAAMGASAAIIVILRKHHSADLHQDRGGESEEPGPSKRFGPYSGYLYLIFALTFIAEVAHFLADNAFYGAAEQRYTGSASLASFIALFFAASGVANLVFSLTLSAYVMRRFGIGFAIVSLPLLVGAAAMAAIASSFVAGASAWFFAAVCAAKLFDEAVRNGVYSAGFLTLFQPLPPELRTRAHAIAGSYFEQIGAGVAGAALLGLNFTVGFSPVVLLVSLALVCVLWVLLGGAQTRGYRAVLGLAFERRGLGDGPDLSDEATLAVIERRLAGDRPGEVLYAMTLLADKAPGRLVPALPLLIEHPDPDVRCEALAAIGRIAATRLGDAIRVKMHSDPSGRVRGAALRALAMIDGAAAVDEILPRLDAQDDSERLGAYVALMRDAGMEGLLEATPRLLSLLRGRHTPSRRFAATVLHELASPHFYRLIAECICSEDVEVQRLALRTAARIGAPPLRPLLIELLRSPRLGQAAVLALVPLGEAMLADAWALAARADSDGSTRVRVANLSGRIGGARAIRHLVDALQTGDLDERAASAAALYTTGHVADEGTRPALWAAVESNLTDLRALAHAPVGEDAVVVLMRSSLREVRERQRVRLLHLLGAVLPRKPVAVVLARFRCDSSADRAMALELLNTLLPRTHDNDVLGALGESDDGTTIEGSDLAGRLLTPDHPSTPWLRGIAAFMRNRADGRDPHLPTTPLAQQIGGANPGTRTDSEPMLLIEKVILLRTVSIFEQVPDSLLADIAYRLVEVEVTQGQVLMREEEVGNSLYIVIEGHFRVRRGDRDIAELGEGDVIGELALLDPEPRSATVEAVGAGRLFMLGAEDLEDLIAASKEIAVAFVRVLSRRLRDTNARLVALGASLSPPLAPRAVPPSPTSWERDVGLASRDSR